MHRLSLPNSDSLNLMTLEQKGLLTLWYETHKAPWSSGIVARVRICEEDVLLDRVV